MVKRQEIKQDPVVIIGAGIVGVSTALWLQRHGYRHIVVLDREGPAAGTSYGNGGVLASCGIIPVPVPGLLPKVPELLFRRDGPLFLRWSYLPRMLPWLIRFLSHGTHSHVQKVAKALTLLLKDSLEQHRDLVGKTQAEQWLHKSDYLYLYPDEHSLQADQSAWDIRRKMGYDFKQIALEEIQTYMDSDVTTYPCAVRLPNHGIIGDPGRYVQELAQHFIQQGGVLLKEDVIGFDRQENRICAVITKSQRFACQDVVLATGAWSKPLARELNLHLPLESERGYHIELISPSVMPRVPLMLASRKCVVSPMEGRLRCAGLVEFGGLEAPAQKAPFRLLLRAVKSVYPRITYQKLETWMGHRPTLTDSLPIISQAPGLDNAYLGLGHQHVGLTGGPKTGRILADMIAQKRTNVDYSAFSALRFKAKT